MNSSNALVVRNQSATVRPAPARSQPAMLSERLAEAQEIAKAGNLIPQDYRNNPGAVMLAMNWAERHDVDLFGAMANVAFFGGKATVSADMQRDLAGRMGFFTRVTAEGTEPDQEFCTVTVFDGAGAELGSYTFTHEMAKGTDAYGRNKNYQKELGEMLLARATTRALKRYASGPGLASLLSEPQEPAQPVEVLEQAAPVYQLISIATDYDLDQAATEATIAEAEARGYDPGKLGEGEAADMSAWIEQQIAAGSQP